MSEPRRYYSDAKTSGHPSRHDFVSFVMGGTTGASGRFAPSRRPTLRHRARVLSFGGHPLTPPIEPWKWLDLPSSRTNPLAAPHMLIRPRRDRAELALTLRPTRPRLEERPWLSRWTFEAQSHGLMACCLRFKAPRLSRHDARLASDCAATLCRVGFAPTGFALKSFSYVFSSHRIFLSRAYLARSPSHYFLHDEEKGECERDDDNSSDPVPRF